MTLGGALATACVFAAFSAAAQHAQAAPKPQAPPQKHATSLKPVPGPGSGSSIQKSSTAAAGTSSPASRTVVAVHPAGGAAPSAAKGAVPVTATPVNSRAPQRPTARRDVRADRDHGRVVGFRDAAGFVDLREAAGSASSALLLVAGLLLVVLVIGETAFLGLVGPPAPSRLSVEETVPIRRMQLRR
jgi:hypothetical protein